MVQTGSIIRYVSVSQTGSGTPLPSAPSYVDAYMYKGSFQIYWEYIDNADGYYLYMNGSLYDTIDYTSYYIDMSDFYNNPENYRDVVWSFYVVAYNSSGESPPSETVSFYFNDYFGYY